MSIELKFVGDVADLIRGVESGERSLDELRDTLGQVGDSGAEAGETAGDALEDLGEGAAMSGREVRSIGRIAKEALEGDLSGAVQAATPLLMALGPAGVVAGAAAAVGIGALTSALEGTTKAAQVDADEAAKWAQAWLAAGESVIGQAAVTAGVLAIQNDGDRYTEATKNATDWGVAVSTAMRAMAGDATALAVVQARLNERTAEADALLAAQEEQTTGAAGAAYELVDAVDRGWTAYDNLTGAMTAGQEAARNTSEALLGIVADAGTATEEVDALGNKLYTLPDGTTVVVNADTGLASQEIDQFKGDVDGIAETVDTTLIFKGDTSQVENQLTKLSRKTIKVPVSLVTKYGKEI